MSKKDEPATKGDVEEIVNRVVTEVVGEVATEILNTMAERFAESEAQNETRFNRLENILRPTVDKVDDHEVWFKHLEAKAA
jgi:hypothetical protein